MMDHQTWRRNLLSVIRDLADVSYQERVWLRGAGPEVDSMNETICRFFDDYDVDGFLAESIRRPILSVDQRERLTTLRDALDTFLLEQKTDDPQSIRHPKWHHIQELAGQAFHALSSGESGHPAALAHRS